MEKTRNYGSFLANSSIKRPFFSGTNLLFISQNHLTLRIQNYIIKENCSKIRKNMISRSFSSSGKL